MSEPTVTWEVEERHPDHRGGWGGSVYRDEDHARRSLATYRADPDGWEYRLVKVTREVVDA